MSRRAVPAALIAVAALCACADSGYERVRSDAEPLEAARAECTRAAQSVPQQTLRQITMRQIYENCMRARGWGQSDPLNIPRRALRL